MLNIFQLKLFCQQDFISSCTVTIWVVAQGWSDTWVLSSAVGIQDASPQPVVLRNTQIH